MSATARLKPTGQWLNREEQAARLGVSIDTIAQYVRRYGPTHPNPYPTHVDGKHKQFGKSTAVLDSALDAWDDARTGPAGRPRLRPPELTVPQWRALGDVAAGRDVAPRLLVPLAEKGLAQAKGKRWHLTSAGRRLLDAHPVAASVDKRHHQGEEQS